MTTTRPRKSLRQRLAAVTVVGAVGCGTLLAACGTTPAPDPEITGSATASSSPTEPGHPPTRFRRATGRPTTVLFVGDSLTGGFFASTPGSAFPILVANWIGPVSVTVAQRAHQDLSTVAGVTEVPPGVDLAVVELGTNDLGRTAIGDFDAQYEALLTRIRDRSPSAAVVCLGVWSASPGRYDAAIQRRCADVAGVFIPLQTLFIRSDDRGPADRPTTLGPADDFHPNDLGHRAIAQAIIAELAR